MPSGSASLHENAGCVRPRRNAPKQPAGYYLLTRPTFYRRDVGADHKPSSVPPPGCPKGGGDHSSGTTVACCLKRRYPRTSDGPPLMFSYLVLLRMGFAKLSRSPWKLVSSYLAFSPLPAKKQAVYFLWHFP